jgi:TonB family protein
VARKLAGKNSLVPKESLRKGVEEGNAEQGKAIIPGAVSPKPVSKQQSLKKPQPVKAQPQVSKAKKQPKKSTPVAKVSSQKHPPKLKLDSSSLFAKLEQDKFAAVKKQPAKQEASPEKNEKVSDRVRETKLRSAVPFQRLSQPGGLSRYGSSAHLPNIPDGQLTLLNAKADRHAVFVRRVALQVFGKLKQLGWTNLSGGEINRIHGFAVVEAIMSPQGKLLGATVQDSSGLRKFDSTMLEAGEHGTWDQNPPESAKAADGNIHFIFKAKSWSVRYGDTGREKRWLLMATGLL